MLRMETLSILRQLKPWLWTSSQRREQARSIQRLSEKPTPVALRRSTACRNCQPAAAPLALTTPPITTDQRLEGRRVPVRQVGGSAVPGATSTTPLVRARFGCLL